MSIRHKVLRPKITRTVFECQILCWLTSRHFVTIKEHKKLSVIVDVINNICEHFDGLFNTLKKARLSYA